MQLSFDKQDASWSLVVHFNGQRHHLVGHLLHETKSVRMEKGKTQDEESPLQPKSGRLHFASIFLLSTSTVDSFAQTIISIVIRNTENTRL